MWIYIWIISSSYASLPFRDNYICHGACLIPLDGSSRKTRMQTQCFKIQPKLKKLSYGDAYWSTKKKVPVCILDSIFFIWTSDRPARQNLNRSGIFPPVTELCRNMRVEADPWPPLQRHPISPSGQMNALLDTAIPAGIQTYNVAISNIEWRVRDILVNNQIIVSLHQ